MGRRLVGGVLVGLGLVAASLAWAAFSLTRTVLDPESSDRIAEAMYDDPQVQAYVVDAMSAAVVPVVEGVVPPADVQAATRRALDDPQVEELLVGGLVRAHQRFLGEDPRPDEPIVVDGSALVTATRRELVNSDPELLASLPEVPSIAVTLPTDAIPDAGGLRSMVIGAVALLAVATLSLVAAAFVITDDRARVLRRVGFWAIGAAAFWVIVSLVVPSLAHLLMPDEATVMASLWGAAAQGMVDPSITAAAIGVVALILSIVWMAGSAIMRSSRRRSTRGAEQEGRPRPADRPEPPRPTTPSPVYATSTRTTPSQGPPTGQSRPVVTPGPATPARGTPVIPPSPSPAPSRRWVEGVGYVDDTDSTRPGER